MKVGDMFSRWSDRILQEEEDAREMGWMGWDGMGWQDGTYTAWMAGSLATNLSLL